MKNPLDHLFPDTWEYDFQPLPEEGNMKLPIDLPPSEDEINGVFTCGECGCEAKTSDKVPTPLEDFCSIACADKFTIAMLRRR